MLPATDENSKELVNSLIEYSIPGNIPEGFKKNCESHGFHNILFRYYDAIYVKKKIHCVPG